MKRVLVLVAVAGLLLALAGPAAASAPTGFAGIYSVAACQDTTTVAVSGTSTNATNRVKVKVYAPDSNGNYVERAGTTSGTFGSGYFLLPVLVDYSGKPVDGGTQLRIDVQLQGLSGSSYVNIGPTASTYVAAADMLCANKCSATITTSDRAPVSGTVTVRSHYGSWFRPEGWTHAAMPVSAGQMLHFTVVGIPCISTLRVWYYPASGPDRTPRMLPAQYWPDEFGASTEDGAIPYAASFAKGLKATKPLESDDPYAPK